MKQVKTKLEKVYTLNSSVEELHLSVRSANVLRDNQITTIGELVDFIRNDKKTFLSLKNLGKTSAEEIFSILNDIKIAGIQKDNTDFLDRYNFSKRAMTVFEKYNVRTVHDFQKYSIDEIKNWRNIGKQTFDEIVDVLESIKSCEKTNIIESEDSDIVFIQSLTNEQVAEKTNSLAKYNFSNRTLHVLENKNIKTLDDLRKYSLPEIRKWRNLGEKTFNEIIDALSSKTEIAENNETVVLCIFQNERAFNLYEIPSEKYLKIRKSDFQDISGILTDIQSKNIQSILNFEKINVFVFDRQFTYSDFYTKTKLFQKEFSTFLANEKIDISCILNSVVKYISNTQNDFFDFEYTDKDFLNFICKEHSCLDVVKKKILEKLSVSFESRSTDEIKSAFPEFINKSDIVSFALAELENENVIKKSGDNVEIVFPSVIDYVLETKDEKIKDILSKRLLQGLSLEEIGQAYNISRERVRQIINKNFIQQIKTLTFSEDRFAFIYQKYNCSKEQAKFIFGAKTAYYFVARYESGKLDLEDALDDKSIPQNIRKKIRTKIVYSNYIYAGKAYIKKYRPELIRYYIKRFCTEDIEIDTFIRNYSDFWRRHGIEEELCTIEDRTFQNRMMRMKNILYKYPRSFRFYDFEQYDFTELLDILNLSQYENAVLSTALFVKEYPKLMKKYDIRDEYELHSLLRTLLEGKDKNITFHRMPTLEFGKANIDEQVIELLRENSPISSIALSQIYEEKWGANSKTALGSYFRCISGYLHKGVYTIDLPDLTAEEKNYLKQHLTADFYTIQAVKEIYLKKFTNESHINPRTLKSLGFVVNENHIVQNKFETASKYFKYLLLRRTMPTSRMSLYYN